MDKKEPIIVVHGGAVSFPGDKAGRALKGTQEAALEGYRVLKDGKSALDAVEAAICKLEDDPTFDAGYGSPLTAEGEIEMDAVIMDGKTLNTGAVASIREVKNPIKVARKVMEETNHCFLVGEGAKKFATEMLIAHEPTAKLTTLESKEKQAKSKHGDAVSADFSSRDRDHDTVGAVAIDADGNIAFGTSTGGINNKKPGRVGDSPIAEGISLGQAAKEALGQMSPKLARAKGNFAAGVIGIDKDGSPVIEFMTKQMAWAWAQNGTLHNGVNLGDNFEYNIQGEGGKFVLQKKK